MQDDWDLGKLAAGIYPAKLVYYDELDSTNDLALEMCRQNMPQEGFLLLTRHQRRGRGRGMNRWWSADGALTFSWVPAAGQTPITETALLPLAVGLAVTAALQRQHPGAHLTVKWPNDVLLNDRKVAGILVELALQPVQRVVIGVGVNVNNTLTQAPQEVRRRAISCIDAWGRATPRVPLLLDVLAALDEFLGMMARDRDYVLSAWRSYCALTGKYVEIQVGRQRVVGQCQGIDDTGALRVYTWQGCQRLTTGTVVCASDPEDACG